MFNNIPKYTVVTKTATDITLSVVKSHLKLDSTDTSEDTYLTILLNSAVQLAEKHTKLTLTATEFKREFKDVTLNTIEIRKSPFVSLDAITVNGDSYDIANVELDNTKFPYATVEFNSVYVDTASVEFTAGYSTTPSTLQLGILNLIAFFYENRGDCPDERIPADILCYLSKYKLIEI